MSNSSSGSSGGIGLAGALTIAFVVLKLCHVIDWSWWWVLSPLWITGIAIVAILLLIVVGAFIYEACKTPRRRR